MWVFVFVQITLFFAFQKGTLKTVCAKYLLSSRAEFINFTSYTRNHTKYSM